MSLPQTPPAIQLTSRNLPAGHSTVALRPFDPEKDTSIIYKWMSLEYEGPLKDRPAPPKGMEDCYTAMLESDMTQPFIGTVNNTPICQINISSIQLDVLSLAYDSKPGDYVLQLLLAPLSIQDNMVVLLQACLEYFFEFQELTRIVTDVDNRNEWLQNLYTRVGFRSAKRMHGAYRNAHLLFCNRSSFKRSLSQPLLTGGI